MAVPPIISTTAGAFGISMPAKKSFFETEDACTHDCGKEKHLDRDLKDGFGQLLDKNLSIP